MKWGISDLKIIHWDCNKSHLVNDRLYIPEMRFSSDLFDMQDISTDWRWKFTWRFRLYDETNKYIVPISCIGENYAFISYPSKGDDDLKEIYRIYGSCKINFELKLQEIIRENILSPDIRYQNSFDLPQDSALNILATLQKNIQ